MAGCAISCIYFLRANELTLSRRLLVSCHGALVALLYTTALLVSALGFSRHALAVPFWLLFFLPAASVFLALRWVQAPGTLHFLLLALAAAAVWSWFIGTMAVTGEWL
jgi:hypothetical protein